MLSSRVLGAPSRRNSLPCPHDMGTSFAALFFMPRVPARRGAHVPPWTQPSAPARLARSRRAGAVRSCRGNRGFQLARAVQGSLRPTDGPAHSRQVLHVPICANRLWALAAITLSPFDGGGHRRVDGYCSADADASHDVVQVHAAKALVHILCAGLHERDGVDYFGAGGHGVVVHLPRREPGAIQLEDTEVSATGAHLARRRARRSAGWRSKQG